MATPLQGTVAWAPTRFERTVYGTLFGDIPLAKLRTPRIKEWRDALGLSKGSSNRTLTALKAALNLAVANRHVSQAAAQEWGDVKPYTNATQRRTHVHRQEIAASKKLAAQFNLSVRTIARYRRNKSSKTS